MKDNTEMHVCLLDQLQEKVESNTINDIFKNAFNENMAFVAITTLKNIHLLIQEYIIFQNERTKKVRKGENAVFLFGLLQGIFAAIDALYSIGKSTSLNKLLIHINQNNTLKEIKRIRNDVVGHPTYRFYNGDFLGYCLLELENVSADEILYHVYTMKNDVLHIEDIHILLIDIINGYYSESNEVLKQTLHYINLKNRKEEVALMDKIFQLFVRCKQENNSIDLLQSIKNDYVELMNVGKEESNRFIWRIHNIEHMFQQEQNQYIQHLTLVEIRKLYFLAYELEKQFKKEIHPKQLFFTQSKDILFLKRKLKKQMSVFENIVTDINHPFYTEWMTEVEQVLQQTPGLHDFYDWMKQVIKTKDSIVLYAIGSELKKNRR